jgi:hypothetical protein
MRLEVLNGFSRFNPDLESHPVPLVQLEGRRQRQQRAGRSQRSGRRKLKPLKALVNPIGTAKQFVTGEDKQAERQARRRSRRKARRQRGQKMQQSQRANRSRAVRIANRPGMERQSIRSKQIPQTFRPKGIQGLRPEVAQDLKEYCFECQMNGVTPTMDDFLNGKAERQARREARRKAREERKAKRQERKEVRQERRDTKKAERIERKDRRADRKEARQTRRQERKQQRQDRRDLRITERKARQEARQQARLERQLARQENRLARREGRGEGLARFGESLTEVAGKVVPGLMDRDLDFGVDTSFQDFIPGLDFQPDDGLGEGMTKEGSTAGGRQGKDDNFLKKYGLIIAGVGVGAFLLLRNKGKKKK